VTQARVPHRISVEHNVATKGTMAVMGHRSPAFFVNSLRVAVKPLLKNRPLRKLQGGSVGKV
jgi:hypothetical protein